MFTARFFKWAMAAAAVAVVGAANALADNPTFTKQEFYNGGAPREGASILWGDYNNDGYADVLVCGAWSNTATPRLYHNNGDGTFTDTTVGVFGLFSVFGEAGENRETYKAAAAWLDYDNDGDLDLVLSGDVGGRGNFAVLFRNTGAANGYTLENSGILLQAGNSGGGDYSSRFIGVADYNGDGYVDILISNNDGNRHLILYKNDAGTGFTAQTGIVDGGDLVPMNGGSVVWGDYNNDGYPDILCSGYSDNGPGWHVAVYTNKGDGTFTASHPSIRSGTEKSEVTWIDYNNDGYLDIYLNGWHGDGWSGEIWENKKDGTFANANVSGINGTENVSFAIGDINGDGWEDIIQTAANDGGDGIYYNNGDGTFTRDRNNFYVDYGGGQGMVAIIDFDNDGDLDIAAVGNYTNPSVWKNNNVGTVSGTPAAPTALAAGAMAHNDAVLSWTAPAGAGLRYNVYVAKEGKTWSLAPADLATGKLKIGLDNVWLPQSTAVSLAGLPGGDYTWSVQAVNSANIAGAFAASGSFTRKADTVLLAGNSAVPTGNTTQLTATILPDGVIQTLAWTVESDGGSATVDATGLVSGVADGFVTIVATVQDGSGARGTHTMLVGDLVSAISVSGGVATIYVDSSIALTVATTPAVSASYVAWSVAGEGSLTFTPSTGSAVTAKATQRGEAKIIATATDGSGMADTITVTVVQRVSSISISGTNTLYSGGTTATLTASAQPDNANNKDLTWAITSGTGIIQLSATSGSSVTVTPLAEGSATITVTADDGGGVKATYSITVYPPVPFTKIASPITGLMPFPADVWAGSGIVWGDYDADGNPDILLWGYENGRDHFAKLYHNEGNGEFTDVTESAFVGTPLPQVARGAAAWFKLDNDARLDFVILGHDAVSGEPVTKVFRSKSDGTFEVVSTILPAMKNYGAGSDGNNVDTRVIAAADYDGDGYDDLLFAASLATDPTTDGTIHFALYKNNGANDFVHQTTLVGGGNFAQLNKGSVAWGDYNGDGTPDILYTGTDGTTPVVGLYKNVGGSSFEAVALGGGYGVAEGAAAFIDYDGDSKLDIVVIGKDSISRALVYHSNGDGTFANGVAATGIPGASQGDIAVADLNGDGKQDVLLVASSGSGIYLSNGDGTFTALSGFEIPADMTLGRADIADYDGDGKLDLLVNARNKTGVYRNTGTATAPIYESNNVVGGGDGLQPIQKGSGIAWGDYDGDGLQDFFVWGNNGGVNLSKLFHNDGNGNFSETTSLLTAIPGLRQASAAWLDYNQDGKLDLLVMGNPSATDNEGYVGLYKNSGSGFELQANITTGLSPVNAASDSRIGRFISVGDYNNDGYPDLLVMGSDGSNRYFNIFRNEAGRSFSRQAAVTGGKYFDQMNGANAVFGDFDKDGDLDILFNGYADAGGFYETAGYGGGFFCGFYRNNGDGTFATPTFFTKNNHHYGGEASEVAWFDYNDDGYLDAYITGNGVVDTEGWFTLGDIWQYNPTTKNLDLLPSNSLPAIQNNSIALGDIDGNGKADLIIYGNAGGNTCAVWYNNGGGSFTRSSFSLSPGNDGMVALADFNGDGKLDVSVVGTTVGFYLNTSSDAVPAAPAVPTDFVAEKLSGGRAKLTWTATPGADGYNLYFKEADGSAIAFIPVDLATGKLSVALNNVALVRATTLAVSGLSTTGDYTFGVQAIGPDHRASAFATTTFGGSDETAVKADNQRNSFVAYKSGSALVVSIEAVDNAELAVYSITGAKLWSKTGAFAGETYISTLPSGAVYVVVLRTAGRVEVQKIAF